MADFDFVTTMIGMITAILDFLFQWLGMALAETGRAATDTAIR